MSARFGLNLNSMRGLFTRDRSPHLDPPLPLTKIFFSGFGAKHEAGEQQFYLGKGNL